MAELKKGAKLIVYIPDTRGVELSRFGKGNLKIGADVYTYSRLPGDPFKSALGSGYLDHFVARRDGMRGTCPGATEECQKICYAARPVAERGPVMAMWHLNTMLTDVPAIPEDCKLLRIHVSGDFDTTVYIENWIARLTERPDVQAWAYTRSWRVPHLLPALEKLRALPNVQFFASMDESHTDVPPEGWRRAWIDGDRRAGNVLAIGAHTDFELGGQRNQTTYDGGVSFVCPEETKHKANCVECGYCFAGQKNDVTFLRH